MTGRWSRGRNSAQNTHGQLSGAPERQVSETNPPSATSQAGVDTAAPRTRLRVVVLWAVVIVLLVSGAIQDTKDVVDWLPHHAKKAVPAATSLYPAAAALDWGLDCTRSALNITPTDDDQMGQRTSQLTSCLDPNLADGANSPEYDPNTDPKSDVPLAATDVLPYSITPSDAHYATAVYSAIITGDRRRFYAATIYAPDATHFLMEGLPHPIAAPADSAKPPEQASTNPSLVSDVQPRLDNFFTAYFTNNTDAMSALTLNGVTFNAPPNDAGAGQSPYRGISSIQISQAADKSYQAIVFVRLKDSVTQLITVVPYRVQLVKQAVAGDSDTSPQWLVASMPGTPNS